MRDIDPFELLLQGRFDEAEKIYTNMIKSNPTSQLFAGRALVYLNMEEFDKALADTMAAEEFSRREMPDRGDCHLQYVGLILWLKGQEKEAAEQWFSLVREMDAGKIAFSDMAGGVINGTLLWFAACFNHELSEYKEKAEKYLKKKIKLSRAKYWPGPIAQYLLGNLSDTELRNAACEATGLLQKRHLCQAYFYIGVKAFHNGDIENCRKLMEESVKAGKLSLIEKEYYLAKHELARITRSLCV